MWPPILIGRSAGEAARAGAEANQTLMADLRLPRTARYPEVLESLRDVPADGSAIRLQLPAKFFAEPDGLALLTAWLLRQKVEGRVLEVANTESSLAYIARMDFFKVLGLNYEERFRRHSAAGRFVPLKLIAPTSGDDGGASAGASVDAICDMVLRDFEDAPRFLAALEWAAFEIVDNIQRHAEATSPGVLCAQYFPKRKLLEIAIFDVGRGILSSLGAAYDLPDSTAAIRLAVQPGVTDGRGAGNGLAGVREILRANRGHLQVWSLDARVWYAPLSTIGTRTRTAAVPGTGVVLSFHPDRPTPTDGLPIVGARGWYYVHAELERIGREGVRVATECDGVASGLAARGLRRKLRALLDDDVWNEVAPTAPVTLDFVDAANPSTDFLDELLGMLVSQVGPHVRERLTLTGLSRRASERAQSRW